MANTVEEMWAVYEEREQIIAKLEKLLGEIRQARVEREINQAEVEMNPLPPKPFDLVSLARQLPTIANRWVILHRGLIVEIAEVSKYSSCMDFAVKHGLEKNNYFIAAHYILAALLRAKRAHHLLMQECVGDQDRQARINKVLLQRLFQAHDKVHEAIQQALREAEGGEDVLAHMRGKQVVYALAVEVSDYILKILG